MEALALLCTLHADGPSSLRRLRRAGCSSLNELETLAPDELARILEVPPAVARRLGREARGLVTRLDLGPFEDREEAPELGAPAGFQPAPARSSLGLRDRALLDQVLDRWKSDEARPAASPARAPEVPPLVVDPPGEEPSEVDEAALAETVEARPRPEPSATSFTERPVEPAAAPVPEPVPVPTPEAATDAARWTGGELDGLDAALSTSLAAAGVTDLATLVAADALPLAREVGVPFAELRRLQFLARRATPTASTETIAAAPPSPSEATLVLRPATELPLPLPRAEVLAPEPAAPEQGAPEPSAPATSAPAQGESAAPEESSARKFWEPRPQWADGYTAPMEEPIPLPPEEPTPPATARAPRPRRPGRVLEWTFDIPSTGPTQPESAAPFEGPFESSSAAPAPIVPPPTEPPQDAPRDDEGSAGPFA